MRVDELLGQSFRPEEYGRNEPKVTEVTGPSGKERAKKDKDLIYEDRVFDTLWQQKDDLDLTRVWRLQSSVIDGALETQAGKMVAIEVKYRMNWMKACQGRCLILVM